MQSYGYCEICGDRGIMNIVYNDIYDGDYVCNCCLKLKRTLESQTPEEKYRIDHLCDDYVE